MLVCLISLASTTTRLFFLFPLSDSGSSFLFLEPVISGLPDSAVPCKLLLLPRLLRFTLTLDFLAEAELCLLRGMEFFLLSDDAVPRRVLELPPLKDGMLLAAIARLI